MKNILEKLEKIIDHQKNMINSNEIQDSEFTAFFYIRNTEVNLAKDITQVLNFLHKLEDLNKKSALVIAANLTAKLNESGKVILSEILDNSNVLIEQFLYLQKNIAEKKVLNSLIFWLQNEFYINNLIQNYRSLEKFGLKNLPVKERLYFRTSICNMQDEFLSHFKLLTRTCEIQMEFLEKYIPKNVDAENNLIFNNLPSGSTIEEAADVQRNHPLENFACKKEIKDHKKFWNTFSHAISKSFFQHPSDHEKWISFHKTKFPVQ